jgi:hypothetical protein
MTKQTIYLKFADILKLRDGLMVKKGNIQLKRGD